LAPVNLRDVVALDVAATVALDEGIPLSWVPRTEIVVLLIEADGPGARIGIVTIAATTSSMTARRCSPDRARMGRTVALVQARRPDPQVDGEVMADAALRSDLRADYPFSLLRGDANVLVFPSLEAANSAYKLLQHLGGATTVGPIPMGMARSVHVLARGAEVSEILNIHRRGRRRRPPQAARDRVWLMRRVLRRRLRRESDEAAKLPDRGDP
jgi:Phosphate acetyl/butaryl transferase